MDDIKTHRAPNGKVYAVWRGLPICDRRGGLSYFDTEEKARDTLKRCDLILTAVEAQEERRQPGAPTGLRSW